MCILWNNFYLKYIVKKKKLFYIDNRDMNSIVIRLNSTFAHNLLDHRWQTSKGCIKYKFELTNYQYRND